MPTSVEAIKTATKGFVNSAASTVAQGAKTGLNMAAKGAVGGLFYNKAMVYGTIAGATTGMYLGSKMTAWDDKSYASEGAGIGAKTAMAGVGLYSLTKGIGSIKGGSGAGMLATAGIGAAIGIGAGAFTGSSSLMANAAAGAVGAFAGVGYLKKGFALRGGEALNLGKIGVKSLRWQTGPKSVGYSMRLNNGWKSKKVFSTTTIGSTAGALFAPAIAHSFIGDSRTDKSQNRLNR